MISNYVFGWGQDPHIPVLLACCVAMLVGKLCGHSYADMLAGGLNAVSQSLEAIIIILCVGCLIGSFEWTGTIPAVVYYGLQLISPKLFLPLACILCWKITAKIHPIIETRITPASAGILISATTTIATSGSRSTGLI